jgi:RNA polymerase sigma-70 factor (family 1)
MSLQDFKSKILPMKDKLLRMSLSLVKDREQAEDIVQEVMIRIWERRESWPEIENLQGYCMRMVRNRSIDIARSPRYRTEDLDKMPGLEAGDRNPHQSMEQREAINLIARHMETLPEKQRTVIRLREIEGLSYLDIASAMDITMDQVKVTLYRARNSLKNELLKLESYGLQ